VAFLRRVPRFVGLAWLLGAGCSLALDTDSLQQATPSGAGGSSQDGGNGEAAAPDGALDAPTCSEPGPDPCAQCQAAKCCPESSDCTRETRCSLALVALQQCRRDARLGDNSRVAITACNEAFVQNGGARATAVLACMGNNCMASCGGG